MISSNFTSTLLRHTVTSNSAERLAWCHLGKKPTSRRAAMWWWGRTSFQPMTHWKGAMSWGVGSSHEEHASSHLMQTLKQKGGCPAWPENGQGSRSIWRAPRQQQNKGWAMTAWYSRKQTRSHRD
eukprot:1157696-Pelagomonas_calceolata.AAC.3